MPWDAGCDTTDAQRGSRAVWTRASHQRAGLGFEACRTVRGCRAPVPQGVMRAPPHSEASNCLSARGSGTLTNGTWHKRCPTVGPTHGLWCASGVLGRGRARRPPASPPPSHTHARAPGAPGDLEVVVVALGGGVRRLVVVRGAPLSKVGGDGAGEEAVQRISIVVAKGRGQGADRLGNA